MAGIEEMMPVVFGKGCIMRIFIDHEKPVDDPDHNWTETTYDGEESSQLLNVPLHWHKHHDEVMEVLSGRMKFIANNKELILSSGDPPLIIPRGQVHGISVFAGEKASFSEKTIPCGEFKALFFQDLYQNGNPSFAMAMRAFYDGDAYYSLPGNIQLLDQLFVTVVGFVAKAFTPARPTVLKRKGEEGKDFGAITTQTGFFMK